MARLVVDRKTNKEVAAELFVSLKTVEAHIPNLFRKLGVSSRAEVGRTVERAERNKGSRDDTTHTLLEGRGLLIYDGDDQIRLLPEPQLDM